MEHLTLLGCVAEKKEGLGLWFFVVIFFFFRSSPGQICKRSPLQTVNADVLCEDVVHQK
jgi:hypothetical protein